MRVSITTLASWSGLHRDTIRRRLSPLLSGERGEQVDSTQALPMLYGEGERLDPAQEKAMLDKARREQAEIDLQLKRREVIALAECFHVIDAAATACREHLMSRLGGWRPSMPASPMPCKSSGTWMKKSAKRSIMSSVH